MARVDQRKYQDRKANLIQAVTKRRRKVRALAIAEKGGRCQVCGYDRCPEALEFHHVDGRKDFGISSKGYTRSWETVRREIDKCVLICANCHREIHSGVSSLG